MTLLLTGVFTTRGSTLAGITLRFPAGEFLCLAGRPLHYIQYHYGCLWDEKREYWLVDEEAAAVVRRIFAMTLEGYGPYQITTQLT